MSCKTAANLTLAQALAIKANQYRSANNMVDYEAAEVDERIHFLTSRRDERQLSKTLRTFSRAELKNSVREVETVELVTVIKDYWKVVKANGFSYELVEIPPVIMSF